MPAENLLKSVTLDPDARILTALWEDGLETKYPYTWLRFNCQCPPCFDPETVTRMVHIKDLDLEDKPHDIQVNTQKKALTCKWNDNHESTYPFSWLLRRGFTRDAAADTDAEYKMPITIWKPDQMKGNVPQFEFSQIVNDDKKLYEWITTFEKIGLCILKNAPTEQGVLNKLGEKIGFIVCTHYGRIFSVISKANPTSDNHTPRTLPLHTDMNHTERPTQSFFLHCIKQSKGDGGVSILANGFYAAELMKQRYPEDFKLLSTYEIPFYDRAVEEYQIHTMARQKVFSLGPDGEYKSINFTSPSIESSFNHLPVEIVNPLLRAVKRFHHLVHEPGVHFLHKLEEGDILCLDNNRVLHGRTAFDPNVDGERHLEGCYINWNDMRSKRRILAKDLKSEA